MDIRGYTRHTADLMQILQNDIKKINNRAVLEIISTTRLFA